MVTNAQRLARRNGKRISELLREVVEACRNEGLEQPGLFFEAESCAIFVMDGQHPGEAHDSKVLGFDRINAIVVEIPVSGIGCPFDCGAW